MRSTTVVVLFASAILAGCANRPEPSFTEWQAAMMQPYEDLKQQKAELWELGFEPQEFEFEGHGKVTVTNWALTGWPGEVHVNAEVRYENTTDEPVTHAIVWLEVLDADGNVVGSTAQRLFNPMGYSLWPGSLHSGAKLRAPTNDVHLDPRGWQWGVSCTALRDDDPGTKPVLVIGPEDQRVRGLDTRLQTSNAKPLPRWSRSVGGAGDARRSAARPAEPGYSYWERQGVQNHR